MKEFYCNLVGCPGHDRQFEGCPGCDSNPKRSRFEPGPVMWRDENYGNPQFQPIAPEIIRLLKDYQQLKDQCQKLTEENSKLRWECDKTGVDLMQEREEHAATKARRNDASERNADLDFINAKLQLDHINRTRDLRRENGDLRARLAVALAKINDR